MKSRARFFESLRGLRRWTVWFILGTVLPLCAGAGAWWAVDRRLHDPSRAAKPFRLGLIKLPPFTDVTAEGRPFGSTVDTFTEAARRRHIPIEWVPVDGAREKAMADGEVDLWPLTGNVPGRKSPYYITPPWGTNSFWLATLASSGIASASDLTGRSILYRDTAVQHYVARKGFPNATLVPSPVSYGDILGAVCLGKTEAGIIMGGSAQAGRLQGVEACKTAKLHFILVPNGRIPNGIGASPARPDARRAADALRAEVIEMAKDGTLAAINFRWFMDPASEA